MKKSYELVMMIVCPVCNTEVAYACWKPHDLIHIDDLSYACVQDKNRLKIVQHLQRR